MIVIQICASLLVKDIQDESKDTRMKIGWIIVAISGFLIAYFQITSNVDQKQKEQILAALLKSLPVQLNKKIDQNIVNNYNMDKNLDNNEEIQSISIIYQTPNVKTRPATNQFLKINKLVNKQKKKEFCFFLKHLQEQSQFIIYTAKQKKHLKS
ncbi:transmembrane protein, putative (macronuclear) [Tetrahymena thermophila SB210]|uniref:Transmembrane protein, putative n=1 Tax=Tetrahymena thermophila (strain SB210) TaxID=312017 RepID=W7XHM3_TETTS|nr:transmembrane protein, putative [Tetrahymena thermophila SB210]EWS72629.1 transmembrane protein, putative [Tetrahymena thermophila SB210]|eukprot:XP_012654912.1 transmembrane protein, putative [Tetrahymena thermophila SB210]